MAMHFLIPDMPVRDLVAAMYKSPEQLTVWVQDRKEQMLGPSPEWRPIPVSAPRDQEAPAVLEDDPRVRGLAAAVGYETPRFGQREALRLAAELGLGEVLWGSGPVYPDFPVFVARSRFWRRHWPVSKETALARFVSRILRGFSSEPLTDLVLGVGITTISSGGLPKSRSRMVVVIRR